MNKRIFTVLITTSMLALLATNAQSQDSFESRFENGKELMKLNKFGLAMQAFKPLINEISGNPYEKVASYYYAVAAYNSDQQSVARDMFLQIVSKFPDWRQVDEVYLWLTTIYLQQGDYLKAMSYASRIEKADARQSATELKKRYLKSANLTMLDSLLHQYPSDKAIAINLADRIAVQPFLEQDRELLENIVSVFDLDPGKYRVEEELTSTKKNKYQIAVLLPFMHDEMEQNPKHLSNEWVIDLYEGILLGAFTLQQQGIDLSIHAYDTEQSGTATAQIVEKPEMKHMDLIIGPLYSEPVEIVSEFAFQQKINMLNPLSNNSKIIGNNPYAFLFRPTYELQAETTAEYVAQNISSKNAFIFYGSIESDSIIAYAYKQEIERRGFNVCHIENIPTEEGKKIFDILTNTLTIEFDASEFDSLVVQDKVEGNLRITEKDYLVIQPDSIGHLFIASYDPALIANSLTALEIRRDSIQLIGLERWLDARISLDGMNNLQTHFIAPNYIDSRKPGVARVDSLYLNTFSTFPSRFSYTGYDLISVVGKLMQKSGNLFQYDPGINSFIPGEIYEGLLFGDKNCNQVVPIVRFEDAELRRVNPRQRE
jgi:hypothetical protein